jgi:hypothetical protein
MRDKEGATDGFRGRILQRGQVVFAAVSGAIDADPGRSGQPPRSGYFQIPPDHPLHCGEEYQLQLDDGQSMTISVVALVPHGHPAVARFVEAAS